MAEEEDEVKEMIQKHQQFTGSVVAATSFGRLGWILEPSAFKVMPTDYKRVLGRNETTAGKPQLA